MAPIRESLKSLRVALESGGFGVDPSTSGSSSYYAVKTTELGLLADQTALLDQQFRATNRNRMSKREVGPDGAQVDFTVPLQGLATAAGDGTSPATADWLDVLMNHIFGAAVAVDGEGLSGATSSDVSLDTDTVLTDPFDLVPIWESGVNSNQTQWRRTSGGESAYGIHRDFDATPSGAGVAYGHRLWLPVDRISRSTLAAYYVLDDTPYTLLGGAITSMSWSMQAGQMAVASLSAQFDNKSQTAKASIPAITSGVIAAGTPIQGELASVEFNGVVYASSSVEIDWGLEVQPQASVAGSNGRSDMIPVAIHPLIRFTPMFQTGIETAFRAGTTGKAMVRFGGGVVSGGVLNSIAVYFEAAQVDSAPNVQADGPLLRQQVVLRAIDPGIDGDGNALPYFLVARA